MRGPAAPTSPGPWDSRSEALLGAPALARAATARALPPGALDLSAAPATASAHHPTAAPAAAPVAEATTGPAAQAAGDAVPEPPAGHAEAIQ
ncbi:hypothetical protein ACFWJO_36665, partial [Streptomyces sp. NPDC127092]